MGTRGFVGFVADDKETITYNHWDSYPSGIGVTVLEFARQCKGTNFYRVKDAAAGLKHVSDDEPPTRDQIVELASYANTHVSTGAVDAEWYVLLRETHGNPDAILKCGYAEHAPEWPLDSLFCEWGYVLDFDTRTLDVYQGFQTSPPTEGRWAANPEDGPDYRQTPSGYYPVNRVASFDLDDLPTDTEFIAKTDP